MPVQALTTCQNLPINNAGRHPTTLRRMLQLSLIALTILGCNIARAAEFTIQVGAFKNPSQAFADEVRQYGEVNTAQNSNGITVFTVGRYNSKDSAKADLDRVRAKYPGAYLRNMPSAARQQTASPSITAVQQTNAAPRNTVAAASATPEAALWESLTDAERRRVVYLDGVLHLKQGDNFVPLSEYRRNQAQ